MYFSVFLSVETKHRTLVCPYVDIFFTLTQRQSGPSIVFISEGLLYVVIIFLHFYHHGLYAEMVLLVPPPSVGT